VYDPVVAESRLRGNEAESVGESKDYDVECIGNEFIVEDTEDSDKDEPILQIKTNCSNQVLKHPPKHSSDQFYPRNLPKNELPQNKYLNWLKNLMNPRRRKLEKL